LFILCHPSRYFSILPIPQFTLGLTGESPPSRYFSTTLYPNNHDSWGV
jgi:hypothetical protein